MINPGKLREVITLFSPITGSADKYGVPQLSYFSASIWADVKKVGGTQTSNNGYVQNEASYLFTIRDNAAATEKCKVVYENNKYTVTFVDTPYEGVMVLTGIRTK